MKAVLAKAESLYNTCDFEHALVLFIRGQYLASDSSVAANGTLKCKKTILNKISNEDVFFFSGSKYFFDHLRKEGAGSTDAYLNGDEKSFRVTTTLANIHRKSMKEEKTEKSEKKSSKRIDRMKADKIFLKNLEKSIKPLSNLKVDPVR